MPGKLTILALASVASGAALYAAWPKMPGGGAENPAKSLSEAPSARAPATSGRESAFYLPETGMRYVYRFRRDLTFTSEKGASPMPPVAFQGEFYVDVLQADPRAFEAVVSEKIDGSPSPRNPLARIEADARGDQLSFFRADGLTEEEKQHVSVVKDLVALWLFPLRFDTVGEFDARFEPLPASQGFARERKTKLAYLTHAPNTPAIVRSRHEMLWDFALHLPAEVKGEETTKLGAGNTALTADTRYLLKFSARERSPAFAHDLLTGLSGPDSLALDTRKPASLEDHPDYKKLRWADVLARLRNVDQLTPLQQLEAFGDVTKYLKMHPEKARELAALLRDPTLLQAGANSALFKNLVGALATSASPEALAALREAYDNPAISVGGKGTILAALTTTQAPIDAATRDFLAQKMASERDPRFEQGAAFALGSALQNPSGGDQAAIQQIQSSFDASAGASRMAMLDAMGNSGRSEFLPTLESELQSADSAAVKAKAMFALRFIKSPAAVQDLIAGLSSAEGAVREAAAAAMGAADWSESFRAPLEKCRNGDALANVQNACASTLTGHAQVAGN